MRSKQNNLTNGQFPIAFVKACLSLIQLQFTDVDENWREENRNLKEKLHVKQRDKY